MKPGYHEGETAIQERLGVRDRAERATRAVHGTIPEIARGFLDTATLAAVCIPRDGRPWVTPLDGTPGFIRAESDTLIRFRGAAQLVADLHTPVAVGSIAIDLQTRRRMRANGRGTRDGEDLLVRVDEVYSNCPSHITPRRPIRDAASPAAPTVAPRLSEAQASLVAAADTFFIGTAHPKAGADASHRGGPPGFVEVVDATSLRWPDFSGNAMLNTLGNLEVDPHAALAFVDFQTGSVLQLGGTARLVLPDDGSRFVCFDVDIVVETERGLSAGWSVVAETQPEGAAK